LNVSLRHLVVTLKVSTRMPPLTKRLAELAEPEL
jgi:hypothetical protein